MATFEVWLESIVDFKANFLTICFFLLASYLLDVALFPRDTIAHEGGLTTDAFNNFFRVHDFFRDQCGCCNFYPNSCPARDVHDSFRSLI